MKDWIHTLKNGNSVGILELGDLSSDNIIFYFHGFPSCRFEVMFADKVLKRYSLRLIALDRPGYGNSDYIPKRKIIDFPLTVKEIADALSIQSFSILGVSGGTPYTLATAKFLPENVKQAVVISGISSLLSDNVFEGMTLPNKILLKLGKYFPSIASFIVYFIALIWKNSTKLCQLWLRTFMSQADREILTRKDNNASIVKMNREALKQGVRGVKLDFELLCKDWGFDLSTISVPVTIMHGNSDCYVPINMGRYNASQIPNSKFIEVPNEGHLMVIKLLNEVFKLF